MSLCDEVMTILPTGEGNAMTAGELAELLGVKYRDITLTVNILRRGGAVICSSPRGFFLPADDSEIERFVHSMWSRLHQIKIATLSAEKRLRGEGDNDER